MGDLKGAVTLHYNFLLLVFSLYMDFTNRILGALVAAVYKIK